MEHKYTATVISNGKMVRVELTAKNETEARRLAEKHGRLIMLASAG